MSGPKDEFGISASLAKRREEELSPDKSQAAVIEFIPVKEPQSFKMMCVVMSDIARLVYGIPQEEIAYFYDKYDDGSFGATLKTKSAYFAIHLRAFLKDLQAIDEHDVLTIDMGYGEILSPHKMALFTILDAFVATSGKAATIENVIPATQGLTKKEMGELLSEAAKKAREDEANGHGDRLLYFTQSRPYSSRLHLEIGMAAGMKANMSIPMTHLYKTICFEDKIPVSETMFPSYGGYN